MHSLPWEKWGEERGIEVSVRDHRLRSRRGDGGEEVNEGREEWRRELLFQMLPIRLEVLFSTGPLQGRSI